MYPEASKMSQSSHIQHHKPINQAKKSSIKAIPYITHIGVIKVKLKSGNLGSSCYTRRIWSKTTNQKKGVRDKLVQPSMKSKYT